MTDKEKAIRWFENIAYECDKLTSGNVTHLRAQIKGMAIRSAEYLTKHRQEPASEELADAINNYCLNARKGYPRVKDKIDIFICNAFEAGAEWQEGRMKKDAVEGGCYSYKNGYVHISCDIDEHLTDIKIGDKVKVIIIKE